MNTEAKLDRVWHAFGGLVLLLERAQISMETEEPDYRELILEIEQAESELAGMKADLREVVGEDASWDHARDAYGGEVEEEDR